MKLILLLIIAALFFFYMRKTSTPKKCNCGNLDPVYLDDPEVNLDQPVQYTSEWLDPKKNSLLI
jgi:hypothetical protein